MKIERNDYTVKSLDNALNHSKLVEYFMFFNSAFNITRRAFVNK